MNSRYTSDLTGVYLKQALGKSQWYFSFILAQLSRSFLKAFLTVKYNASNSGDASFVNDANLKAQRTIKMTKANPYKRHIKENTWRSMVKYRWNSKTPFEN